MLHLGFNSLFSQMCVSIFHNRDISKTCPHHGKYTGKYRNCTLTYILTLKGKIDLSMLFFSLSVTQTCLLLNSRFTIDVYQQYFINFPGLSGALCYSLTAHVIGFISSMGNTYAVIEQFRKLLLVLSPGPISILEIRLYSQFLSHFLTLFFTLF